MYLYTTVCICWTGYESVWRLCYPAQILLWECLKVMLSGSIVIISQSMWPRSQALPAREFKRQKTVWGLGTRLQCMYYVWSQGKCETVWINTASLCPDDDWSIWSKCRYSYFPSPNGITFLFKYMYDPWFFCMVADRMVTCTSLVHLSLSKQLTCVHTTKCHLQPFTQGLELLKYLVGPYCRQHR